MGPILATAAVRAFSSPIYFCFHFRGSILKREILISSKVINLAVCQQNRLLLWLNLLDCICMREPVWRIQKNLFILNLFNKKYHARGPVIRAQKKIRLLELGLGLKHPKPLKAFKFQFILYSHHPPQFILVLNVAKTWWTS